MLAEFTGTGQEHRRSRDATACTAGRKAPKSC